MFGEDTPIVLSDGRSERSAEMEALAADYDCAYVGERVNRGHFAGCQQSTVCALAWGLEVKSDVSVKCNQRLILMSPLIRQVVETVFRQDQIMLALPGRPSPDTLHPGSKFFATFPALNDVVFWRTGSVDPEYARASYDAQWKGGTKHYEAYTEFWHWMVMHQKFPKQHVLLPCLTNPIPGKPPWYLRKAQHSRADYVKAATEAGMTNFEFPVAEWSAIRRGRYQPRPMA